MNRMPRTGELVTSRSVTSKLLIFDHTWHCISVITYPESVIVLNDDDKIKLLSNHDRTARVFCSTTGIVGYAMVEFMDNLDNVV